MRKSFWADTGGFPIGVLSRRSGVKIETIRYYERIDLIVSPSRTEGGHRVYNSGQLQRLNFVRRARNLGFTLDEIRALLKLAESQDEPCEDVRNVAAHHLADVQAKLEALQGMASVLAKMVDQCGEGASPDCPLLEALLEGTET